MPLTRDAWWFSPALPLPPSKPHSSASILECQKHTAKTRRPPLICPAFPRMDITAPFFFVGRSCHVGVNCHKNFSWRVLAVLLARTHVNDPCRVCCDPPSLLFLFVELLLNLFIPSSCAQFVRTSQKRLRTSSCLSVRYSMLSQSTIVFCPRLFLEPFSVFFVIPTISCISLRPLAILHLFFYILHVFRSRSRHSSRIATVFCSLRSSPPKHTWDLSSFPSV